MIEKTYTVTGAINGMHAKTGEIVYWEREVYARNGTSAVVKNYINLSAHVLASFNNRADAERFEAFRIEATTPSVDDAAETTLAAVSDSLLGSRFSKVL